MTVPVAERRAGPFNGNGVTTAFPFDFKIFADSDVRVVVLNEITGVESDAVLGADYTVALNPDQEADPGGELNFAIAPTIDQTLTVVGDLDYEQPSGLPDGGAYRAQQVEDAIDRAVMLIQQLLEITQRSLTLPVTAAGASTALPSPEADALIGWNPTGDGLVNLDPAVLQGQRAFAAWRSELFDGDGTANQEFTLAANPGSINNLDVSVGGVAQRADVDFTFAGLIVTAVGSWPVGTDNVCIRYGEAVAAGSVLSTDITDSSTDGRAVLTAANNAAIRTLLGLVIGADVQAHDDATAKTDADQAWTGSPRATPVTDNDGSFSMNAGLDFLCTPTAGFTLTFTGITAGQRGSIYLVNGSNYAIAAHANTKVTSSLLATISVTGEYWLSYWSPDGTNVLVTAAGDFA